MTPTRYLIARIALAFGIQRRNLRMAEAASETHLLRDAELHLGLQLWEKCEHIDELSVEYWNIRKINKELESQKNLLADCQAKLDAAHEERAQTLLAATGVDPEINARRTQLIRELDDLAARRDEVILKARRVRRNFDGVKTKLEVLLEAGGTSSEQAITDCKLRMREIKTEFDTLKLQRGSIAVEIDAKDTELNELENNINKLGKERKFDISKSFACISEFNQQLSFLNADIGLLQKRKLELCAEIGRYLSRNSHTHSACAAICKPHHALVDVMAALRKSISFNHRIAGI